ncbi:MAG TPA: YggS family pyridoxal phosphate-dependent enzyme [Alphaproteobacteria bacterium]|nr:YggS family pyridoxal phosphate-dependent enzyme [Alphaproteobacteria bacterium]
MADETSLRQSLETVQQRIGAAARFAGRSPDDITLIAVSKTHSAERILPALQCGQRHFGENRVQEAQAKWPPLRAQYPDVCLHLIGQLQSNKAADAVALFDVIHSVDRPSLAQALARAIREAPKPPILLVQVNTGEEEQKGGVMPSELSQFMALCRETLDLPIAGLMCIPPEADDPAPHFAFLRQKARDFGLGLLSMGMSSDFETAIKLGATHVRVGSAIFGER